MIQYRYPNGISRESLFERFHVGYPQPNQISARQAVDDKVNQGIEASLTSLNLLDHLEKICLLQ